MAPIKFAFKLNVHGQRLDTSFDRYVEQARYAEACGFDGVFVIDHLILPPERLSGYTNADITKPYFLDAWTTMAAVAAATKRVRIGPQVTPIGLRHPVFVAKWGATIDHISGGRFLLQVGAGHQELEYRSFGFRYPSFRERFERLVEGIRVIQALWTQDEPINFSGKYYNVQQVAFWPKPLQRPRPRIWFGGASERIQQAVAELGEGWTPAAPQGAGLDPLAYARSLQAIRERARSLGRSEHIVGAALFYTVVSENPSEIDGAVSLLRKRADWANLSLEELGSRGIVIAGKPDEVSKIIERYVKAGVEYFTLSFIPLDDVEFTLRGMELFAEKVMPRFQ